MSIANEKFQTLIQAIAAYCRELYDPSNAPHIDGGASELRKVIAQVLPDLAPTFDGALPASIYSDSMYVDVIIGFGVKSLNDQPATLLWEHGYLKKGSVSEVAELSGCTTRSIYRRKKAFPHLVARELWIKNLELTHPHAAARPIAQSDEQKRIEILEKHFRLTRREAEVILEFCRSGPNIGLRTIADRLSIAYETLRTRCRNVRHKVGASTTNEAAEKIMKFLRDYPEAAWPTE